MNTPKTEAEKMLVPLAGIGFYTENMRTVEGFNVDVVTYDAGKESEVIDFLQSLEDEKKYVFHGTPSDTPYAKLQPKLAINLSVQHGNLNAVYATSIFREAIYYGAFNQVYLRGEKGSMSFGIGARCILDENGFPKEKAELLLRFEGDARIKVEAKDILMFKNGFLYVMKSSDFSKEVEQSPEFFTSTFVTPLFIIRITPRLAHLMHEQNLREGKVSAVEGFVK